ncbi:MULTISPECIES: hypothetical protein [Helcococcus]|uniref:Uncharacterized protein n=1 Tax=Helcococcus bovis TaxID=3153252 RepID=A0ABW9F794_9FIRM
MNRGNTPSDYLVFLDSEEGSELLANLKSAIEKVKPFKIRAYLSMAIGIALTILIWFIFKTLWGGLFILPGVYFFYILSREKQIITEAQMLFNAGLNRFIFGNDYLEVKCNIDFIPSAFIRGLPNVTGLWKENIQNLGKFGQSNKIRITRTFTRMEDSKKKSMMKLLMNKATYMFYQIIH